MVKSLLKLTQPFIHNEPFTLHAIFAIGGCQVERLPLLTGEYENLLGQILPLFFGSLF